MMILTSPAILQQISTILQQLLQDSKTMRRALIRFILIIIIIFFYVLRYPATNPRVHSTPKMRVHVHLHVTVIPELLQDNH